MVEGCESDSMPVRSGVPQGTVLGPLLFLIYINDIDKNLTPGTKLRLFADDSFLYRQINTENDVAILQKDLNTLQKWEEKWKMEFHPDKCQVLKITNKTKPIISSYSIHNKLLKETKNAKYLGIIIDSKLQWIDQNKYVCKKANFVLNFLKRNTSSCPKSIKEKCFKTLVKPILDYGCSIWDPHRKNQIDRIEKVQKNGARYVTNDYTFVNGRTNIHMKTLGWIPHCKTRNRTKIINLYKGLNGLLEIPIHQYQLRSSRIETRQSGYQIFDIPQSKVDSHLHSFFPSTFRLWNNLPNSIKLINNIDTFKNALQFIRKTP